MLRLANTIDETVALLRANGEPHFAERIVPVAQDVRAGNPSAVERILVETTGAMGSLRDVALYRDGAYLPNNSAFQALIASMRDQARSILQRGSHA